MNSLYQDFRKIDKSKLHQISYSDYCTYLKQKQLPLIQTIFHYFSSRVDGLVFPEFVLFMVFFLSLDEIGLAQFLHLLLFDEKFSSDYLAARNIKYDTIERKIQILIGGAWGNGNNIKKIIRKMGGLGQTGLAVDAQSFVNYCLKNRSLITLIVTHHLNLKRKIYTGANKNNWEERNPTSSSVWDGRFGLGNYLMNDIAKMRIVVHILENKKSCDGLEIIPVAIPVLDTELNDT